MTDPVNDAQTKQQTTTTHHTDMTNKKSSLSSVGEHTPTKSHESTTTSSTVQSPPPSTLSSPRESTSDNHLLGEHYGEDYDKGEYCKKLFNLSTKEAVLEDYSCAYYSRLLLHGRLYITEHHLLFYSNMLLGKKTVVKIGVSDITDVLKRNSAYVVPNAIEIFTRSCSYFFTSFGYRDAAFKTIHSLWMGQMKSLYDEFKSLDKIVDKTSESKVLGTSATDVNVTPPTPVDNISEFPDPVQESLTQPRRSLPSSPRRRRTGSVHIRSRSDMIELPSKQGTSLPTFLGEAVSILHEKGIVSPSKITNEKSMQSDNLISIDAKEVKEEKIDSPSPTPPMSVRESTEKKMDSPTPTPKQNENITERILRRATSVFSGEARSPPTESRRGSIIASPTTTPSKSISTTTSTSLSPSTTNSPRDDEQKFEAPSDISVIPEISITEPQEPMFYEPDYFRNEEVLTTDIEMVDIFPVAGVKLTKLLDDVTLPVSAAQFFQLTLANDADFLNKYHSELGDSDVVIDKWADFKTGVPLYRCVTYKVDKDSTYAKVLPARSVVLMETQRMVMTRNKGNTQTYFVMHSTTTSHSLSMDEMFQIEIKVFVADTRCANKRYKESILQVFAAANCKTTFWKTSMEANAIKATAKRMSTWVKLAENAVTDYVEEKERKRIDQLHYSMEAALLSAVIKKDNLKKEDHTRFLLPPPPLIEDSPPPSPRPFIPKSVKEPPKRVKIRRPKRKRESDIKVEEVELQDFDLSETLKETKAPQPTTMLSGLSTRFLDQIDSRVFSLFSTDKKLEYQPNSKEKQENDKRDVTPTTPLSRRDFNPHAKSELSSTIIPSILGILQWALIIILQICKISVDFVRDHSTGTVISIFLFITFYMIYSTGSMHSQVNGIRRDMNLQGDQTRSSFHLVKTLLHEHGNYSEKFVKDTVMGYLLDRRQIRTLPSTHVVDPASKRLQEQIMEKLMHTLRNED